MIKKYTISLVKITIKILNDFSGNTEALIAAKKTLYDTYISQLNDISKLAANNLHPVLLLYDKLESLV
jgi:glutamate dehydrogenase